MSEHIPGIHGTQPVKWQIDRAIEAAKEKGRPIKEIRAAAPFVENLMRELADSGSWDPTAQAYCGIGFVTVADAIAGWVAYDEWGNAVFDTRAVK